MANLSVPPDFAPLRRAADELLRAALGGDEAALSRFGEAPAGLTPASAELVVAREHGFVTWQELEREVERRTILDSGDVVRLTALLEAEPGLATARMEHWCDHPQGATPLGYTAMLRFDTARGVWREVDGTDAIGRVLLAAGAPVDGEPGERETPLITAASYGDARLARVLIDGGADLEARAAPDAGGVPGGTALLHAAVFGMTEVVDVLVAAGARVDSLEEAAAAGELGGRLEDAAPDTRLRALVLAADHERLEVIDELVAAGTPVDATDPVFGGHPLRVAAANGRPASVERLVAHGADPGRRDEQGRTPLDLARAGTSVKHREVEAILGPLTDAAPGP